jgi:hypothetical protein
MLQLLSLLLEEKKAKVTELLSILAKMTPSESSARSKSSGRRSESSRMMKLSDAHELQRCALPSFSCPACLLAARVAFSLLYCRTLLHPNLCGFTVDD